MKAGTTNAPYPEILKFCDWFKKEHDEEGLQYIRVSLPNSFEAKISLPYAQPINPHNFELLFEKSAFFTPLVIEGIKNYVISSACLKTSEFDKLEIACAHWNLVNTCTETVKRHDVF